MSSKSTSIETPAILGESKRVPKVLEWVKITRTFMRRKPLAGAGLIVIFVLLIVAIAGPLMTTADPNRTNPALRWASPSGSHWLGADHLGRDIYSRVIAGARVSVMVGVTTVVVSTTIATMIGMVSGLRGGWVDFVIQRVVDMALAFPALVLLASLSVLYPQADKEFNFGLFTLSGTWARATLIALTLGVLFSFRTSRIIRSSVMVVMSRQYIESARAVGATDTRLMLKYVLPNIAPIIIILATTTIGAAILIESTLSFLGLGLPPTVPSWGQMLNEARPGMFRVWNPSIWPGIAIAIVVWSFNMFGDGLRDVLDPRLRGTR